VLFFQRKRSFAEARDGVLVVLLRGRSSTPAVAALMPLEDEAALRSSRVQVFRSGFQAMILDRHTTFVAAGPGDVRAVGDGNGAPPGTVVSGHERHRSEHASATTAVHVITGTRNGTTGFPMLVSIVQSVPSAGHIIVRMTTSQVLKGRKVLSARRRRDIDVAFEIDGSGHSRRR
jgi:hypothetical protein